MTEVHAPPGDPSPALNALIASRMCHDLSSPLGAIANGLELLEMSGLGGSPEMDLIAESVAHANARVRFFRLAYGVASPHQFVQASEVAATLGALSRGGRLSYEWQAGGDLPRPEVQAAFLLIQCLECALPLGGRIVVAREEAAWTVEAQAQRLRVDEPIWAALSDPAATPPEKPALVQFALLPAALGALGRRLDLSVGAEAIAARF